MSFEKNPLDDRIDELLRDVTIPPRLGQKLLEIPDRTVSAGRHPVLRASLWVTGLATAASLAGLVAWLNRDVLPAPADSLARVERGELPENPPGLNEQSAAQIARLQNQIRLRELEAKIVALERRLPSSAGLDRAEYVSMVLCLADQAAIGFGASPECIRDDMQHVIDKYPNTRGASLAQQQLTSIKQ